MVKTAENGTGCPVVGGAADWMESPQVQKRSLWDYTHVLRRKVHLKMCSDLVKSLQDLECVHAHTACFFYPYTKNECIHITVINIESLRARETKHICINRTMIYYHLETKFDAKFVAFKKIVLDPEVDATKGAEIHIRRLKRLWNWRMYRGFAKGTIPCGSVLGKVYILYLYIVNVYINIYVCLFLNCNIL